MTRPNYKTERALLRSGFDYVIGCDEVGRGSLAGPVVAAAVAFGLGAAQKRPAWYREINDSKLLTPAKRSVLTALLKKHSLGWAIGVVDQNLIDQQNIHQATLLAMHQAVQRLHAQLAGAHGTKPHIVIDGKFTIPGIKFDQTAIINGDAKVLSISAASILAKVYRDDLMVKMHQRFPQYGFDQHKGYGTQLHRQAIVKYGLLSVHRQTFCGNIG